MTSDFLIKTESTKGRRATQKSGTRLPRGINLGAGLVDHVYALAQYHQQGLLRAALTDRLLKAARAGELPVDVQRYDQAQAGQALTLAERYLTRVG
jgi:hypothetical protein